VYTKISDYCTLITDIYPDMPGVNQYGIAEGPRGGDPRPKLAGEQL